MPFDDKSAPRPCSHPSRTERGYLLAIRSGRSPPAAQVRGVPEALLVSPDQLPAVRRRRDRVGRDKRQGDRPYVYD